MLKRLMPFSIGLFVLASACEGPEQRMADNEKVAVSGDSISKNNPAMMGSDSSMMSSDTMHTINHSGMMVDTAKTSGKPTGIAVKKGKATVTLVDMDNKETIRMDKEGVYNRAEIMPSFPGGEKALAKFIQDNIVYPQAAIDNSAEGKVVVSFAVDEAGKIYTPTVISGKAAYGLDEAALKVVNKMPRWNPGQIKGKNVKTRFTLPIDYQIY